MTHGKLMPEREAELQEVVSATRPFIADLSEGETFVVRYTVVKGTLEGLIEPKRIRIRKKSS